MAQYKDPKRNTWYFSVWKKDINNDNKKYIRRGFYTKKEAEIAESLFKLSNKNEHNKNFDDLCNEYLKYIINRVKPRSYQCIQNRLNLHILPYFKNKKLSNITVNNIVEWHEKLNKYSYKYKETIHTHIVSIFNYAIKNQYIDKNVASLTGGFKNNELKKDVTFWEYYEFNQFISNVDDFKYKTFFSFLYYTGLRLGEALALNWNDIKKDIVIVSKTLSQRSIHSGYIITSPKTKSSNRDVLLPSQLKKLLAEYKTVQKELDGFNNDWFVFGGEKPLAETSVTRIKDKYCKLARVKRIKIHDFRHSHASLLINRGANPTIVAQRLGHSDINMTLNTYSHMFPNSQKEVIKSIENL